MGIRLYCTDKRRPDGSEIDGSRERDPQKDSETNSTSDSNNSNNSNVGGTNKSEVTKIVQSIQDTSGPQEKINNEKNEERSSTDQTSAGTGDNAGSEAGGGKTNAGAGENTGSAGEDARREELPPWWPSLPLWKKIFYPSLGISLFSFFTELIYQSTLRTSLPYKQAIHVIRSVDEIEEAFGEIKEPKWYRFWEMLFGYWWVQASGYEGVSKLWIPIVGVKEYKTDRLDKNGEPVMRQVFTRGRAYAEAKKVGAGPMEWMLTYVVVKGDKLGEAVRAEKAEEEWLVEVDHEQPKAPKGMMVLVDRHVQVDP